MIDLANNLRLNGFNVEIDLIGRNMKNNFKYADKLNAKFVILIGEDEVENNIVTVKENETKKEYKIELENLIDFLDLKINEE